MKKYSYLLLSSFLVWLIPFIGSFAFFDQEGNLLANFYIFKLVMIILLFLTSYFIFKRFYKFFNKFSALIAILVTVGVSVLVDLGSVVPFTGLSLGDYIVQIISVYVVVMPISILFAKKHAYEKISI